MKSYKDFEIDEEMINEDDSRREWWEACSAIHANDRCFDSDDLEEEEEEDDE